MAQPSELEVRVAALEDQVQQLAAAMRASQQDAAAARVLAGGADRDVTELGVKVDANRQAINALAEQTRGRFDRLEDKMDAGFAEMRGKLDAAAAGQEQIVGLLTRLIEQPGE